MLKQVIVTLVLTLCLIETSSAIKCYQCRSTLDPKCAEDKIEETMGLKQVNCDTVTRTQELSTPLPVTKCNKVVTRDRAGVIVTRDCHFEEFGVDPNKCSVGPSQMIESCQICKGDLCNTATGTSAMGVLALLAVAIAAKFIQ